MQIDNPAFDYDHHGGGYAQRRATDPRIAATILRELTGAKTVLNVGAGAGSYEPEGQYVVAVEPSATMRSQRAGRGRVPAVIAKADSLPFDDAAFDASMAMVTVHHWPDMTAGLRELRRVTRDQLLVLTFDPDALDVFWNAHYFPELIEVEKARYPTMAFLEGALGGTTRIVPVPVPLDCVDGFQEAFYGRPEAFLEPAVRKAQSAWGFLDGVTEARLVKALADDLASGRWDQLYGEHRTMPTFTGALRLLVNRR